MKESPFNVTSRRNMEDTVSARTFNMIIGGITLYRKTSKNTPTSTFE